MFDGRVTLLVSWLCSRSGSSCICHWICTGRKSKYFLFPLIFIYTLVFSEKLFGMDQRVLRWFTCLSFLFCHFPHTFGKLVVMLSVDGCYQWIWLDNQPFILASRSPTLIVDQNQNSSARNHQRHHSGRADLTWSSCWGRLGVAICVDSRVVCSGAYRSLTRMAH